MQASALDSIEYRVCFGEPSADVRDPIAKHLRDVLAILHQAGVTKPLVKPFLETLDLIDKQDQQLQQEPAPPPPPSFNRRCVFCETPDALIDEEYHVICSYCGFVAETCYTQDQAYLQPSSHKVHCGTARDSKLLDVDDTNKTSHLIDTVHRSIRRLCDTNLLAVVHRDRAMYLCTLYFLKHRPGACSNIHPKLSASCVIYSLLETWAQDLVPVKLYKNQQWITWWVLPSKVVQKKNKKYYP